MTDDHEPFGALRPATPPAALRDRALAAARAALATRPASPDVWTRVARNRAVRFGWAAVVAALALAHVVVSLPKPATRARAAVVSPRLGSGSAPELAPLVRMAAIDPAARGAGSGRSPADKENGS
ncbi:MAG TPA: hypothetical protein VD788_13575 [Candidatus Polarisedimenticolaceae bacterium]|nr:hypothetical protein [Candidatus Polarisedimenticolaceae bacterium]